MPSATWTDSAHAAFLRLSIYRGYFSDWPNESAPDTDEPDEHGKLPKEE